MQRITLDPGPELTIDIDGEKLVIPASQLPRVLEISIKDGAFGPDDGDCLTGDGYIQWIGKRVYLSPADYRLLELAYNRKHGNITHAEALRYCPFDSLDSMKSATTRVKDAIATLNFQLQSQHRRGNKRINPPVFPIVRISTAKGHIKAVLHDSY